MEKGTAQKVTAEEYLARERRDPARHDYLDGEVFAMGGASFRHNLLVANLLVALAPGARERGCRAVANDQRVHVPATGLFTYPDLVVVCGEPEFLNADLDTLLNPVLIIEVLSKSTADYDRGGKFAHYRTLASMREYLVVEQDRVHVEHSRRQDDGRWLLAETDDPGAVLGLAAIGCELALSAVYQSVLS
jgi:Uma2 family endonuclease